MKTLKQIWNNINKIWNLPNYMSQIYSEVERLEKRIGERTTVHADINYRGTGSQIIVVGKYRNKDYVRAFNVRTESLSHLIDILSREEKGANVGHFDMIGGIDFSAVYDKDRF